MTIYCPLTNSYALRTSHTCYFSYGSTYEKISTVFNTDKFVWRFFIAASWMMFVKVERSKAYRQPGLQQVIVAARGALYINDSYPNSSPGWYFFKNVYLPFITLLQSYWPDDTTYSMSPLSPYFIMHSSGFVHFYYMAYMTMFISSFDKPWNKIDFSIKIRIESFTLWVFWTILGLNYDFLLKVPNAYALMPCLPFLLDLFTCFLSSSCFKY